MNSSEQKLQIAYRNIDELIPYARNSRTHTDEQVDKIVASIKDIGWTNPILVDGDSGIIAGHGRLLAAQKLGMKEVPVIELKGLTEAQKRKYIIADNRLALDAGWDEEMLKAELSWLTEHDYDVGSIGFDEDEISAILSFNIETQAQESEEESGGDGDSDQVEELPEELKDAEVVAAPPIAKTKPKEIWILGAHRLMCGDSTDEGDVAKLMGGRASLVLTDPPYNVAYTGKTKDALTIENDHLEDSNFREFLRKAFKAADMVTQPGAAFYIWHADVEGFNFRGACRDVGWTVRECLIWVKNIMVLGRKDYQWKHESCLYGWKEGAAHNWYSDRKQTTVLEFDKPARNAEHPTMKPVELFAYLVRNSTKEGDIVLDSFGGSGTTIIACENLKRRACVMELSPAYCDVIIRRWQDTTGLKAVREDGVEFDSIVAQQVPEKI